MADTAVTLATANVQVVSSRMIGRLHTVSSVYVSDIRDFGGLFGSWCFMLLLAQQCFQSQSQLNIVIFKLNDLNLSCSALCIGLIYTF